MRYLHTMVRITDLDASLDFYCNKLGMVQVNRKDYEKGRFSLIFLAAPGDVVAQDSDSNTQDCQAPLLELTYNWDSEPLTDGRNFGHLAFAVHDIYATCQQLQDAGIIINRPPRDGYMAFIRSPDGISIELLQSGQSQAPREPWQSMENIGSW